METKKNFESYDGTKLVGILSKPNQGIERAAFLLVHGIPSEKDEWGFYKDMATFLSKNGYASFRFDFRYNGESEKGSLEQLTLSAMISDIEAAFWQLERCVSDETPIYVVGTSCGGGATVKWANSFKRDVEKIFLMAPVFDYNYEILGYSEPEDKEKHIELVKDQRDLLNSMGYVNDEIKYGRAMVNEANIFDSIKELDNSNCDIIIFQGDSDTVVPIEITEKNINSSNKDIELIKISEADHGFAVEGDDDLTADGTKENHYYVYNEMIKRV